MTDTLKFTPQESFAAIALSMARVDGRVTHSEWERVVNYIRRLRIYDKFTAQDYDKMFDRLCSALQENGAEALVKASKHHLPKDLKLTAFACAVDIAMVDGYWDEEEKELISKMADILEIPECVAVSFIEVLMIKNEM